MCDLRLAIYEGIPLNAVAFRGMVRRKWGDGRETIIE